MKQYLFSAIAQFYPNKRVDEKNSLRYCVGIVEIEALGFTGRLAAREVHKKQ
jgi:hypothetical protein